MLPSFAFSQCVGNIRPESKYGHFFAHQNANTNHCLGSPGSKIIIVLRRMLQAKNGQWGQRIQTIFSGYRPFLADTHTTG